MDTEKLLRSLNARNVRYVLIGATAFPVHSYARATLDIEDLIRMKEAAGRPKDLEDLRVLRKLKEGR